MSRKVIQIGEHKIQLPEYPKSRNDVLFIDEKMPYWRRQEDIPRIFYDYNKYYTLSDQDNTIYDQDDRLISLSVEDSKTIRRLRDRELQRRADGIWFKNGSDVLWMPGDEYFTLQWAPMLGLKKKYGDFRWFQNDAMILKWHVDNDPNILGLDLAKAKKTGITQIWAAAYANESTMIRGKNFGIMSKTYEFDAKPLNMGLYFYIIENMPDILLPEIKKINEHEIVYGRSVNWRSLKTPTKPLNTRVFAAKTKPSGFDGPLMHKVWGDEFNKYWESAKQSPELVWTKIQETVKLQQLINGKIYLTGYSSEDDNRGFLEAKKIYYDSKLSTISKITGRTKSQLICYTIGTLESAEGHFLANGKTDQKTAFYFNEAERDSVKHDRVLLQAKQRQYPRNEDEAWGEGGATSIFDGIRIGLQVKDIQEEERSGKRSFREGKLLWSNSMWEIGKFDARPAGKFSEVYFEEISESQIIAGVEDRLRIYQDLPAKDICKGFKQNDLDDLKRLKPHPESEQVGGIDPTDYAFKSDVVMGSVNASLTMNLYNPAVDTRYGRVASNIIMSEYFHRPENPDEFYEDMVKEIIYFDKRVLAEANNKWFVTRLKQDNLHNYLLVFKKDGSIGPWEDGMEDKLISSSTNLVDAYVRAIKKYIAAVKGDSGIDYLSYIKAIRVLQQLSRFKAENRRILDLAVSLGLTRLAVESYSIFRDNHQEEEDDNGMMAMAVKKMLNM